MYLLQAFGAVESMSDRYCIHFKEMVHLSAEDLTACCRTCGQGWVLLNALSVSAAKHLFSFQV